MKSNIWDQTKLKIERIDDGESPTAKQLWSLHVQIWERAFSSLGEDNKMQLHKLDKNTIVQSATPALWFYSGEDEALDSVSESELVYSLAQNDVKDPEFAYLVAHHWFRLGLAAGKDAIEDFMAENGFRIDLPSLDSELRQHRTILFSTRSQFYQVVGGDSLSLYSNNGWTASSEQERYYQDLAEELWEKKNCGCLHCRELRGKRDSIVQKKEWEEIFDRLKKEHGQSLSLVTSVLEQLEGGKFVWAISPWLDRVGAKLITKNPSQAVPILDAAIRRNASSKEAAVLLSNVFTNAKSKVKDIFLPAILNAFLFGNDAAISEMLKILGGEGMKKSAILKKHLTTEMVDALVPLIKKVSQEVETSSSLARILMVLDWKKAKTNKIPEVVEQLLAVPHAEVQELITAKLKRELGLGMRNKSPLQLQLLDLVKQAATKKYYIHYTMVLQSCFDDLPEELSEKVAQTILDDELKIYQKDFSPLFFQAEKPKMLQLCANLLVHPDPEYRQKAQRSCGSGQRARHHLEILKLALSKVSDVTIMLELLAVYNKVLASDIRGLIAEVDKEGFVKCTEMKIEDWSSDDRALCLEILNKPTE